MLLTDLPGVNSSTVARHRFAIAFMQRAASILPVQPVRQQPIAAKLEDTTGPRIGLERTLKERSQVK